MTWDEVLVLVGLVLTGGSLAAVFQFLGKRSELKANTLTTAATAELTSVESLTNTIQALSAENGRLTSRLTEWDSAFVRLETKLDLSRDQVASLQILIEQRPNKEDLFAVIEKLREQVMGLGETPANGPTGIVPPPNK